MAFTSTLLTKFLGGAVSVATAATVTAGVVWAGDTVLSSGGAADVLVRAGVPISDDAPDGGTAVDLEARLAGIEARLDAIDARLGEMDATIVAISGTADDARAAAARAEEASSTDPDGLAALRAAVDALSGDVAAAVDTVQRRTANIDAEGRYTGPLRPHQFEGRLSVGDVRGDWPLDRVNGVLGMRNLVRGRSCYGDHRNHSVVGGDSGGNFTCIRIPVGP